MRLQRGVFLVSLDFELYWGVRDRNHSEKYLHSSISRTREAVQAILDVFAEFKVHGTWATVGMLFLDSFAEVALDQGDVEVAEGLVRAALENYRGLEATLASSYRPLHSASKARGLERSNS